MFSTKVEITLPKAEPGKWSTLNIPAKMLATNTNKETKDVEPAQISNDDNDSDPDLNDIEQVRGVKITDA